MISYEISLPNQLAKDNVETLQENEFGTRLSVIFALKQYKPLKIEAALLEKQKVFKQSRSVASFKFALSGSAYRRSYSPSWPFFGAYSKLP